MNIKLYAAIPILSAILIGNIYAAEEKPAAKKAILVGYNPFSFADEEERYLDHNIAIWSDVQKLAQSENYSVVTNSRARVDYDTLNKGLCARIKMGTSSSDIYSYIHHLYTTIGILYYLQKEKYGPQHTHLQSTI